MRAARRRGRVRISETERRPGASPDMERLALLTLLGVLAIPSTALAAPVKISPRPAPVSATGAATVEVANPNRHALRGTASVAAGARTVASRSVRLPKLAVTGLEFRFDQQDMSALR